MARRHLRLLFRLARFGPNLLPLGDALRREERLQREAFLDREGAGADADQQQVRRFLHDAPGDGCGVANVFHPGDAAAGQGLAVHDTGVEGHGADRIAQAAIADGVDRRIVLDGLRTRQGRIEGRLAGAE